MEVTATETKRKTLLLPRRGAIQYVARLLIVVAVYVATGRLGLLLGAEGRFATLVWVPSGLAVAALFLWGYAWWPAITLGAFLVNILTGAPWFVAVGISIGNTLEALICAMLLRRGHVRPALDSLHDVLVLVLLAAPTSALVSATLGVGSLRLGGIIGWSMVPMIWSTWWLGDVISMLLLTPLLLTWSAWPRGPRSRKHLLELSLLSLSLLVVGLFVFLGLFRPSHLDYPIAHLVYPLLTWGALRYGPRGATALLVTLASLAIVGTILGVSPFSTGSLWLRLLSLQSYMGIAAVTALVLAAIVAERHALEQRKDDFINMASHELRTPLTSLLSFTQVLQRQLAGSDHPPTLRALATIERQAKQLSRLVADLLDLSKIQAGKLTFAEEIVDVDALAREVVEQFQQTSTQHEITIEGNAPGTIIGDRDRLSQVMSNLLTNSMKYSPQATQIIVHLTSTAEGPTVSVQDFGNGIPQPEQQKIFERFYRIAGEPNRLTSGLGVGLFIARQIIEHHRGRLWVESREGEGATFSFSLPWPLREDHGVR
ncbi:MAG TPA: MASE1 domain-containing protein [Ktedonobacterales bacterium]|nr:MASE1 domain-containing protein [Ktedonobacterales bacterium]